MTANMESNSNCFEEWPLEDDEIFMKDIENLENQHKEQDALNGIVADKRNVILFECCGTCSQEQLKLARNSILGRGALAALLRGNSPCPWMEQSTEQTILGCHVSLFNLLENRNHFVNAVRQNLFVIEQSCLSRNVKASIMSSSATIATHQLRLEIVTVFNSLWWAANYLCSGDVTVSSKEECARIVSDVYELLTFFGPLHILPQYVTAATSPLGNECPSAAYQLFHLHLDVRWWSLATLLTIERYLDTSRTYALVTEPGNTNLDNQNNISQALLFVIWDLLVLSSREVAKCEEVDVSCAIGLPCSCCAELAVSVQHICQELSSSVPALSFWELVQGRFALLLQSSIDGVSSASDMATLGADLFPPPELRGLHIEVLFRQLLTLSSCCSYNAVGCKRPQCDLGQTAGPRLLRELILWLLGEKTNQLKSQGGSSSSSSHSSSSSSISTRPLSLSEEKLRRVLRCCLLLCVLWQHEQRTLDCVLLLWDKIFSKKLSSSFLSSASVQELASVSPRVSEWVSSAAERCQSPLSNMQRDSSYHLFLRIIGCIVKSGGERTWQVVRGRVLSKFGVKRLQELCSTGLYNLATLLLTLSHCSSMHTTAQCAVELLCASVSSSSFTPGLAGKLVLVVQAVVALALMLVQAGYDASSLLESLAALVTPHATQLGSCRDVTLQREVGRVLSVYFSAGGELCSLSSDLSLGQRSLYEPWLQGAVSGCCTTELPQLLHGLQQALQGVLGLVARHRAQLVSCVTGHEVVASIDRGVSQFLRTHSTSSSALPELAPLSASLTLAHAALAPAITTLHSHRNSNNSDNALESAASGLDLTLPTNIFTSTPLPSKNQGIEAKARGSEYRVQHREAAAALLQFFLTTEHINNDFVIDYMTGLFTGTSKSNLSEGLEWLSTREQELLVCRALRCALLRGSDDPSLLTLLPYISSLPLLSPWLPSCPPACPFAFFTALVRGMCQEYRAAATLQAKHKVQSSCAALLSGTERTVQTVLQQVPPPAHLQQLLHAVAEVIRDAAVLLYIKSKGATSPLANLLTSCLLTSASYRIDRPLPVHLSQALYPVIPKALYGLCTLAIEHDPYLKRLVRTIFNNFIHRYPSARHPIVAALCLESTSVAVRRLRELFIETLQNDFLQQKWDGDAARLNYALQVTVRVLSKLNSSAGKSTLAGDAACAWSSEVSLLPLILQQLLTLDDKSARNSCIELIKIIFDASDARGSSNNDDLATATQSFVQQHLGWHSNKVFEVLSVLCALRASLVAAVMPELFSIILSIEQKRGTGCDSKLRLGYERLQQRLKAVAIAGDTQ